MRMIELIKLENFKQQRRISFIILLAGILTVLAWIWEVTKKNNGWEYLIYACFLENATSLPIIISVFASRQMDLEHRGDTWKLLYTFATPYEIFFTKIIRGTIQIFTAILIEAAGILFIGLHFKYSETIPVNHFAWMIICNFLISEILFLIHSMLSFFAANQAASICLGITGFFISLFLEFVKPGNIQRLIPWGLFGNTLSVRMDWNKATKKVKFFYTNFPFTDLAVCIIWLSALIFTCVILLKTGNTDERVFNISKERKQSYKKDKNIILPTELLKMRQLPPWLSLIILPVLSAFMGTFNYLGNKDVLTSEWYSLWSQHTLFLNFFFMPVIIGVLASSILHVEHTGTNWNQLLVNSSAAKIILQKYAALMFFNTIAIVWTTVLYVVCGKYFCGFANTLPKELPEWMICGLMGTACISGFQLLISLIIKNYVFPIGVSCAGSLTGIIFTAHFKKPYILPYSLLAVGMRSNNPTFILDYKTFFVSCTVQTLLYVWLCIFYANHSDV